MKFMLLTLLGLSWAVRIAAFKIAAERGVPPLVTIQLAVIGIVAGLALISILRRKIPPRTPVALRFYALSGCLGFVFPFALETFVAGHIPAFVFIVIISSMSIWVLLLTYILRIEPGSVLKTASIFLGFAAALLIAWDNATGNVDAVPLSWILLAFLVPILYTINTVFVASRWPEGIDAIEVATGQALVVGIAVLIAMPFTGLFNDMWLLERATAPVVAIIILETSALLIYLRIIKAYGATFVSLANYVSMLFGAIIGYLLFYEAPGFLTLIASIMLVVSLHLIRIDGRPKTAVET